MTKKAVKTERNTLSRRSKIIELLNKQNDISISAMSKMFQISEVSVRNDLAHLEEKGLLIRTRGGAITKQPINFDLNLNQRLKRNYKQKQRIGKKAVEYIQDGFSIVLDSGSTTLEIARNLKGFKNLKLITNSLPIAELVADNEGVEVIMPGGILRPDMRSLMGSMAEKNLLNYYCDITFIGADSIDSERGIYTPLEFESSLSQTMMKIGKRVIVVVDSTKFDNDSLVRISPMEDIDIIITDNNISGDDFKHLSKLGLELVVV